MMYVLVRTYMIHDRIIMQYVRLDWVVMILEVMLRSSAPHAPPMCFIFVFARVRKSSREVSSYPGTRVVKAACAL